ncbi:MAG: hypothetical protein ABIP03_11765 [Aquihabitans sp.]
MPDTIPVDPEALRTDVREKYREVALHPEGEFHFHTGRPLAALLGYPFDDISVGLAMDAFGGSGGDSNARAFDVAAHVFLAHRPAWAANTVAFA